MKWNNRHLFGRFGVNVKLVILMMILISIVTGVFSLVNLEFNNRETALQAQYTTKQALEQTASFIDNKCLAAVDILDIIASNDTILELIMEPKESYDKNLMKWWVDATKLNTVLFNMRSNKDINQYHLYFSNGLTQISDNKDFTLLNEVEQTVWYKSLQSIQEKYQWFAEGTISNPESANMITVVRKIPSFVNLQSIIGLIRADMPIAILQNILSQGQYTPSTTLVLTNAKGELISASDNFRASDIQLVLDIHKESEKSVYNEGDCNIMNISGASYLAGWKSIQRSDWTLTAYIPSKDVLALGIQAQRRILVIFFIMIPVALPIVYIISRSSTNRIRRLTIRMRSFGKPNDSQETQLQKRKFYGDEIDELEYDYEEMIERIDSLMSDMYSMGKENKNLELKALQAQINPHFLYNTLDMINMMGIRHKKPEITAIVKELAAFYRLSLGKGEDIVTIKDEIDLVQAYVKIQNMRFDDCVSLVIDIPDELLSVRIPKIILQPLVENAVLHGILETSLEKGIITITGIGNEDLMVLTIQDNGLGMSGDKVERLVPQQINLDNLDFVTIPREFKKADDSVSHVLQIFDEHTDYRKKIDNNDNSGGNNTGIVADRPSFLDNKYLVNETTGYGVRNIDERLKIFFGDTFGLHVKSKVDYGTIVYIVMPK